MTDKVIPSPSGDSNGYIVARIIEFAGGSSGWIQESSTALLADNDTDLDQTAVPLNAFGESHSASSFDVTIDTGEGFIGGSWVARDTTTTVTLASDTTGQSVYAGWDHDATETMIIGTDSAFGAQDPQLEIWTFDTDGSGVTSATDQRPVGQQSDLGVGTLDDGSKIGRFLMTAVTDSTFGTAGAQNKELFRAPGATSDLLMAVDDGNGALTLAYNAYFDGSWKFTVGNTRAYLLQFSSDEIRLRTSSSASASADTTITWVDVSVSDGNISADDGTTIWNGSAVPKSSLGGPASSLTSYPLPAGDINDGSGSGLDADLLDGKHSSEIGGGDWTVITTYTDTDDTTDFRNDFGTLSTTYDQYELDFVLESADSLSSGQHNEIQPWVQNDRTSSYETLLFDLDAGTQVNSSGEWTDIAKHNVDKAGIAHATIRISADVTGTKTAGRYPQMSVVSNAGVWEDDHAISGIFKKDVATVDQIAFRSQYNGTGVARLKGRDL